MTDELTEKLRLAENALDVAIRALTGTLEYEWDGEFLLEIEALNEAHIRYQVAKLRVERANAANT